MRPIVLILATLLIATPAAATTSMVEAQLCRSQLSLLVSGNKLTEEEIERFESQCACLEQSGESAGQCSDFLGDL
ncbi:hypothetical protein SAMN05216456_0881 [Devosia crocina]|uniref:Uncharacterized protein n=1 Tax=Devosia crocina TaxID=429728 RepID=A0A1I7N5N3_9HYPH|nr:hypothetical protein [Devosia crocina]SFV29961.1 hypothetical protein SAMN05216456_0881 [Devosia crocina]